MKAKELLDAGQLTAAIEELNKEVKTHPADTQRRTFLFELLCFAGDYQRAERQLEVIGQQSSSAEVGVQVYRNVLAAEQTRRRLFSEGLRPAFLANPPPYVHLHLEAVNRLRERNSLEARRLLEASLQSRPVLTGTIDGEPFEDFQDSDDIIGPCLEIIVGRNYIWLPFEQIKTLQITAPKRLRDLLWIPAFVAMHTNPVGEVLLPVLYCGSHDHAEDIVKLGRATYWQVVGNEVARGAGQRLFLVGDEERAVVEVREIKFTTERNEGSDST